MLVLVLDKLLLKRSWFFLFLLMIISEALGLGNRNDVEWCDS
uniref:Uncharacterized protein n=1 Tax=Phakopsora pachyrhizi TaxID=170000 RepID=A0A0S1MIS9_PHAPC